jgi:hypothetical protein
MSEPVPPHDADQLRLVVVHLVIGVPGISSLARDANEHDAVRLQNAMRVVEQATRIRNVFEHVVENRRVEALGAKGRQLGGISTARSPRRRHLHRLRIDVGTHGPRPECQHVADAAADVDGVAVQVATKPKSETIVDTSRRRGCAQQIIEVSLVVVHDAWSSSSSRYERAADA